MLPCHDNFEANFDNYPSMLNYHQALSMASSWHRCRVKDLHVEPLDTTSPLYGHPSAFAAGTSEEAIEDTAANLGLALNVDGNIYPVRSTAYKTLIERAKVGGTALPKLSRKDLANVLNSCLSVHNSDALLLIRDEKVSAAHSGDETDYSVLPMDELLVTLTKKLGERFPGFVFESGYGNYRRCNTAFMRIVYFTPYILGCIASFLAFFQQLVCIMVFPQNDLLLIGGCIRLHLFTELTVRQKPKFVNRVCGRFLSDFLSIVRKYDTQSPHSDVRCDS